MAISRQSSAIARWIGVHVCILGGACIWPVLAGERDFELYYTTFQTIEDQAKNSRLAYGDKAYLSVLYSYPALMNARLEYMNLGAHPEVGPPNRNPDADEAPRATALNAAREFIQKNYNLWAAAYLTVENAPIEPQIGKKEALMSSDPFADLDAPSDPTRRGLELKRDQLGFFYSEDLFLQKRVEQLARLHGNDDSELVAGLTGRQIIAYMREHLPEPDPRVLTGGAEPAAKRSIVDPANRFSDGVAGTVVADGTADRRTRPYLWPLIALVLMACAWGFILVRRARR